MLKAALISLLIIAFSAFSAPQSWENMRRCSSDGKVCVESIQNLNGYKHPIIIFNYSGKKDVQELYIASLASRILSEVNGEAASIMMERKLGFDSELIERIEDEANIIAIKGSDFIAIALLNSEKNRIITYVSETESVVNAPIESLVKAVCKLQTDCELEKTNI
ncbi:hypothetical protein O4H50_04785 [Vibrio diazotrophicus]|uniref:hypothetical protein n=1 Tax=Vibrio diazotrophicus TaxID=685 RepID=UPI0022AFA4D4|nr:hypothetical protein [Vibrio diazotrophicus]MCZ4371096.1 hypothetical protein [Vibrio diazotrophicus]